MSLYLVEPRPSRHKCTGKSLSLLILLVHRVYFTENKAALCEFYLNGVCSRGNHCPFRHMRGERTVVCKHWLRHLCKKGDECEFLHEYEMSKMPICYFFQRFGECNNKDCQYLHVDAETLKIRDCAWYDRGFCKHGERKIQCHVCKVSISLP